MTKAQFIPTRGIYSRYHIFNFSGSIMLQNFYQIVQKNCHISDSLYAQDYGLCTYLLRMRQLYRWEKKLPMNVELSAKALGEWVSDREQLWEHLLEESFACLPIGENCYDPFDTHAINDHLLPQQIVYGGGYERFHKPSFFVGRLQKQEQQGEITVFIVAEEYARDVIASPAMALGNTIFVRREMVYQWIWERIEEDNWQKNQNPYLKHVLSSYGTECDLEEMVTRLTEDVVNIIIYHEFGEVQAGHLLGQTWENMLTDIAGTPAELLARAIRDHLADCLVTLPKLSTKPAWFFFHLANFKGMRRQIFPTLEKVGHTWLVKEPDTKVLAEVIEQGKIHWLACAHALLTLYLDNPQASAQLIQQQLEKVIF